MTKEEAKQFFDMQKEDGMTDEQILFVLYKMYKEGAIDAQQLEALCAVLGYEFSDKFEKFVKFKKISK